MGNSILRGFLSIFGGNVATLALGLITTPIIVRILGSSKYGDYAFLLSLLGITMIIANAGIFDGIRKYIAEDRDDENWTGNVFGFYLRVAICLSTIVVFFFICLSLSNYISSLLGKEFNIYFILLGLLIFTRQSNSVVRGVLMGFGLEELSESLKLLKKVIFSITGIYLVYMGFGVYGLLTGHIIGGIIVSILGYYVIFNGNHISAGYIIERTPDGFPRKKLLIFNIHSTILILLTASLYHIDVLFLRIIVGDAVTGYYKAALIIVEFLWFVPNTIQILLLHSSSEMWSNDEKNKITAISSKITRYNLSLVLIMAVGIGVLAEDFVLLYFGNEFRETVEPLLILLPGVIGFAIARPIFAIGQGKGDLHGLIIATGTAALLNICLNLILIPTMGMIGAAIATSTSYGSMMFAHIIAARKIGFNPIDDLRFLRLLGALTVSTIFIYIIASLTSSSVMSLFVVPPLGGILYISLLVKIGVVDSEDVNDIYDKISTKINRILLKGDKE